jgi:hypothetical protein
MQETSSQMAFMTMIAMVMTTINIIQRPGWLITRSERFLVTRG